MTCRVCRDETDDALLCRACDEAWVESEERKRASEGVSARSMLADFAMRRRLELQRDAEALVDIRDILTRMHDREGSR